MRVAVAQFATSSNVQENLASCIRMINEAARCQPSLIVLPEFCNTLFSNSQLCNTQVSNTQAHSTQSCYLDHNQAWQEALELNGPFLQAIAQQAKNHDCYIVINVTLRQDLTHEKSGNATNNKANISITSCLFSPLGELIHQQHKHTLMEHEKLFFISRHDIALSENAAELVTTPFGKLGLLIGDDSLTFEVSRELALNGAQLLCNSINTFALDQSNIHDPARACENKVFFVTANKVGSLLPNEKLIENPQEHIPLENLISHGVGQSQIVSPDGKVLAKITNNEEGFVFADIDLAEAGANKKRRPDGTDINKQRRPELYQKLTAVMQQSQPLEDVHATVPKGNKVPLTANVAIFATYKSNEEAINDVCHYIENNLSDIIQLPELFFIADKSITHDTEQRAEIACLSKQLIEQVSTVLRPYQYLCTSLVIDGLHQAVLISEQGLLATQQQLHFCQRYQWTALGDELNIIDLPLEQGNIKLAMLTGDDANSPEIVKVAALNGIHLLLVAFDIQAPCEVEYSLLSRAAENRICIVAASREKSFANSLSFDNATNNPYSKNKVKAHKSTGLIVNLTTESSLLPQWQARKFNGYINQALVKLQYGKITKAVIHPIAACNK